MNLHLLENPRLFYVNKLKHFEFKILLNCIFAFKFLTCMCVGQVQPSIPVSVLTIDAVSNIFCRHFSKIKFPTTTFRVVEIG